MDEPLYEEPAKDQLFQCFECDVVFAHPEALLLFGDWIYACPECQNHEFFQIPFEVVYSLFAHIIGHVFSASERMNLRLVAENEMGPFDPADRKRG